MRKPTPSVCPEFAVCEKRLKRAEVFQQAARDREAACAYRMRQFGGG
jgi:hypothetical protein